MGCGRKVGPYDCCTVVCGDCLELMKALPEGCVDAVITDPPYNASQESHGLRRLHHGDWDSGFDVIGFLPGMFRILKGSAYVFCGDTQFSIIIDAFRRYGLLDRTAAWIKKNPTVINGDKIWLPSLELCVFGKRPGAEFHAHCERPIWEESPDADRVHPCQKPVRIIAAMALASSSEGGFILDPFAGSGTTGVAAKKLGRHFVLFEINEEYCRIARERIALVEAQPSLFESRVVQETLRY